LRRKIGATGAGRDLLATPWFLCKKPGEMLLMCRIGID
jgi:hypothetical protein